MPRLQAAWGRLRKQILPPSPSCELASPSMSWVPAPLGQREALKLPESHPVAYVNWQEKRRSDRRMAHRFLKEIREEHRRFLQAAYDEADGTPKVGVNRDAVIQAS